MTLVIDNRDKICNKKYNNENNQTLRNWFETFRFRFQSKLIKLYLQYATDCVDGSTLDRMTIILAIPSRLFVKYETYYFDS